MSDNKKVDLSKSCYLQSCPKECVSGECPKECVSGECPKECPKECVSGECINGVCPLPQKMSKKC